MWTINARLVDCMPKIVYTLIMLPPCVGKSYKRKGRSSREGNLISDQGKCNNSVNMEEQ